MTLTAGFSSVEEITSLVNLQHNAPKTTRKRVRRSLSHRKERKRRLECDTHDWARITNIFFVCVANMKVHFFKFYLSLFVFLPTMDALYSKNALKCHLNLRTET